LHLTGGGNGSSLTLDLVQSDETDFRVKVAMLAERGRKINEARLQEEAAEKQAKIKADQLAQVQNLTKRMSAFIDNADTQLPQFAPAEQRYRIVTERMRAALAREQSIYGEGQAAYARSQIAFNINQASFQTNYVHNNIQTSQQNFTSSLDSLGRDLTSVSWDCSHAHVATVGDPNPGGDDGWNSACLRFLEVAKKLQTRIPALQAAFAHVEEVWQAEHREQEAIVRASELAAR
jgi:hypothetical protein